MSSDTKTLRFDRVELDVPASWEDMSEQLGRKGGGVVLSDSAADVGALRVSLWMDDERGGPALTSAEMLEMIESFAEQQGLPKPQDQATQESAPALAGASFRDGSTFLRIWYASDGWNVAVFEYTCEWEDRTAQLADCERIVRTVRFTSGA